MKKLSLLSSKGMEPIERPGTRTLAKRAVAKKEEAPAEEESRRLGYREKLGQQAIQEQLLSRTEEYEIVAVQSMVYDPAIIRRAAAVKITRTLAEAQATDKKWSGTVKDHHMGPTIKSRICATCGMDESACPGHIGAIELAEPVYLVGWLPEVIQILSCMCRDCGKLLISEEEIRTNPRYTMVVGRTRLRRIAEASKKKTCSEKKCLTNTRKYEGIIDDRKSEDLLRIQIKRENVYREIDTRSVHERLIRLSDEHYRLLGYTIERSDPALLLPIERETAREQGIENGIPIRTHPKNFVTTIISVYPVNKRPDKIIKNRPQLNDETVLYDQIVAINGKIIAKRDELEKMQPIARADSEVIIRLKGELSKLVSDLTLHVARILNSEKYKSSISRVNQLKGVHQQLQGKKALIRGKQMGHITNNVTRNVAGTDPFLYFGESAIPASSAYQQFQSEKVFSANILSCMRLLRRGDVLFYAGRNDIKIEVTPEFQKHGQLEIGMTIYRRTMNGDVVVINRNPSIHMYSIQGTNARVRAYATLGTHMAVTTPLKLDYDGDEMQTHFLQTYGSQADAIASVHIRRNIINIQTSSPLVGGVYNVPVATTLLSRKETTVSQQDFVYIITRLVVQDQLTTLTSRLRRHYQTFEIPFARLNKGVERLGIYYALFLREVKPEAYINEGDAYAAFRSWLRNQNLLIEGTKTSTAAVDLRPEDFTQYVVPFFLQNADDYYAFINYQKSIDGGRTVFSTAEEMFDSFKLWLINIDEIHLAEMTNMEELVARLRKSKISEDIVRNRVLDLNRGLPTDIHLPTTSKRLLAYFDNEQTRNAFTQVKQRREAKLLADQKMTVTDFRKNYLPGFNFLGGIFFVFAFDQIIEQPNAEGTAPLDYPLTITNAWNHFKEWFARNTTQEMPYTQAQLDTYLRSRYGDPIPLIQYSQQARKFLTNDTKNKLELAEKLLSRRRDQLEGLEGDAKFRKEMQISEAEDIVAKVKKTNKAREDELDRQLKNMDSELYVWIGLGLNEVAAREEFRYPGRVLLSAIMPASLNYAEYGVTIRDGVVIDGIFTADVVGTKENSLIQSIWNNYGSERAADFISDLYFLSYAIYTPLNMTISLADLSATNPLAMLAIEEKKAVLMKRVQVLAASYPKTDNPVLREKYERDMLQLTRDFADIGSKVVDALDTVNNIALIAKSKAKGKASDFSRMMVDLQQATLSGQRLPQTLRGGTVSLPYFSPNEGSLESRGFIGNSYIKGLEPDEYYQHALAGRQGIVDTQQKSSDVGDDHRRLVKSSEDLKVAVNGEVYHAVNKNKISFCFGNHSLNPKHLRLVKMRGTKIASPFYPSEILSKYNSLYSRVGSKKEEKK